MEKLYKKDNKGNILEWFARLSGRNDIMMSSGRIDGNKTISWRKNVQGKNKGKINETTPMEQATKDIESAYADKKKRGYKSLEDLGLKLEGIMDMKVSELGTYLKNALGANLTTQNGDLKPMKCQQYYRKKPNWTDPTGKVWKDRMYYYLLNPHVKKESGAIIMNFPVLIQPKINGVRCTADAKTGKYRLLSKEGLEYNLPHITDALDQISITISNDLILDGELYIPGESLQNITSAVRVHALNTLRVEFHIFDIAGEGRCIDRIKTLKNIIQSISNYETSPIKFVKTLKVANDELVQEYTDKFIEEGYEGSILRDEEGLYEFGKRPKCITKLKRLLDEEFKITGVVSQEVNPEQGMFVCKTKEGRIFTVNPTMSNKDKEDLLNNTSDYIGKLLTVKFYEYTDEGKPRHIVDSIVRDYE